MEPLCGCPARSMVEVLIFELLDVPVLGRSPGAGAGASGLTAAGADAHILVEQSHGERARAPLQPQPMEGNLRTPLPHSLKVPMKNESRPYPGHRGGPSTSRSRSPALAAQRLAIGDRVTVAESASPELKSYVGQSGTVDDVMVGYACVRLDGTDQLMLFDARELRLEDPSPG